MNLPQEIEIRKKPGAGSQKYAVFLFLEIIAVGFGFEGYFPYGKEIAICAILVGIPLLIIMVRYDYFIKRGIVRITEEGILEISTGKEVFIAWTEYHQTYYDGVELSTYMIPIGTVANTQIFAEGKKIVVDYAPTAFQENILQLSGQHILPQLRQRLKKGVKLYFGPLELTTLSIFHKGKEIRRDHVSEAKLENGKLILKQDGGWFPLKVNVGDIPNLSSLIVLLSEGYNPTTVKGTETNKAMDV